MAEISMFLIAFFLLISWLLCLEASRATKQDLSHVRRHLIISLKVRNGRP